MNLFQNKTVVIEDIKDIDFIISQLLTMSQEEIEELDFALDNLPEFVIKFKGERYDDGYLPYEMLKAITDIQNMIFLNKIWNRTHVLKDWYMERAIEKKMTPEKKKKIILFWL